MNAVEEYETREVRRMLGEGKLPRPESKEHAVAFHRAGGRIYGRTLLLCTVTLPAGWTVDYEKGQNGMLRDECDRVRGYFFYKAQDGRGHLRMAGRYYVHTEYPARLCTVRDRLIPDEILFMPDASAEDSLAAAWEWLNVNYPDWRSPIAYWHPQDKKWWQFWK